MTKTRVSAVVVASEITMLRAAWTALQQQASVLGMNTVRFAQQYSTTYAKIRLGKDERLADDAVKSLNAAIGIDDSKASMFRRIAARGDLFVQHKAQLPASLDAMYQVAQLPERRAEALFGKGKIHPGLTVRDARKLKPLAPVRKPLRATSPETEPQFVRLEWSPADQPSILTALRSLADQCPTMTVRVSDRRLRDNIDQAWGAALRDRIKK